MNEIGKIAHTPFEKEKNSDEIRNISADLVFAFSAFPLRVSYSNFTLMHSITLIQHWTT